MNHWLSDRTPANRPLFAPLGPNKIIINTAPQSALKEQPEESVTANEIDEVAQSRGFDEGYQTGLKQATEAVQKQADEAIKATLAELHQGYADSVTLLMSGLKEAELTLRANERKQLVSLVKQTCEKVLDYELNCSDRKISQAITSSLSHLSCAGPYTVSISPDDEPLVAAELHTEQTTIIVDHTLSVGQFSIDSPSKRLRIDPEAQLSRLLFDLDKQLSGS